MTATPTRSTPPAAGRVARSPLLARCARWGGWAAGLLLLAAAFMLYTDPQFMVMMADQVWACF